MKNLLKIKGLLIAMFIIVALSSCERVAPNYAGVLMESYGKQGKADFTIVSGRVWTCWFGMELFQVPLYDQRAKFEEIQTLKAADNTEFTVQPEYTYRIIRERAIDVVFDNKHIGAGDKFMKTLEDKILEPKVVDLMKEESRKHKTDSLMADGGSLLFENRLESIVKTEFKKRGIELLSFSSQIQFSDKVRGKIDSRNEVNTNISVIDQQIEEQKKRNELEKLRAQQSIIKSEGITQKVLMQQFIEKWDGHAPLYQTVPEIVKIQN
jgi:regulator of protease activity HflC (stomatin/prohibitin superfamily)